jgi:hypothetical protein
VVKAHVADQIIVDSIQVDQEPRKGQVLEVLGEPGHEHYRVQWEDGHESSFFPSSTAHTVQVQA